MRRNLCLILLFVSLSCFAKYQDPTKPIGYGQGSFTRDGLQVQAIYLMGEHRTVLVNGVFMKEGDTIAGITAQQIEQDGVNFTYQGELFYVPLVTESIKKDVPSIKSGQ